MRPTTKNRARRFSDFFIGLDFNGGVASVFYKLRSESQFFGKIGVLGA
jgi:hypothetical protein